MANHVLCRPNSGIEDPEIDPSHDPATAILRRKAAPNKLMVDDATNDDNSVITLSTATMERLQLFRGDTVIVKGKKRRDTVLIVLADDDMEDNKAKINKGRSFFCLGVWLRFLMLIYHEKLSVTTCVCVLVMCLPFIPALISSTVNVSTSCPLMILWRVWLVTSLKHSSSPTFWKPIDLSARAIPSLCVVVWELLSSRWLRLILSPIVL